MNTEYNKCFKELCSSFKNIEINSKTSKKNEKKLSTQEASKKLDGRFANFLVENNLTQKKTTSVGRYSLSSKMNRMQIRSKKFETKEIKKRATDTQDRSIQKTTRELVMRGSINVGDKECRLRNEDLEVSCIYRPPIRKKTLGYQQADVQVWSFDSCEMAYNLSATDINPVVCVLGFHTSSLAWKRSNLSQSENMPSSTDNSCVIHGKQVGIIRNAKDELCEPYYIDIIADTSNMNSIKTDHSALVKSICFMLDVAMNKKYDAIVFHELPDTCMEQVRRIIQEEYAGCFRRILFCS